jgi:hypothetical protein
VWRPEIRDITSILIPRKLAIAGATWNPKISKSSGNRRFILSRPEGPGFYSANFREGRKLRRGRGKRGWSKPFL